MSLQFVIGRAGSGKSTHCLHEIESRIRQGVEHPLVLLVPEQFSLQAERNLVGITGKGGILKTDVLSFRRLAYRIFNDVGGLTYPHLHAAGKCMVIAQLLLKKGNYKLFARSADQPGFVSTIATMITEFKQYRITPDDLTRVGSSLAGETGLPEKLVELSSIYREYEQTIASRYQDADDDLSLLAKKLNLSTLLDGSEIWIDGFSGFTPQEFTVIARLLTKAQRVCVCLCLDDSENEPLDIFTIVQSTMATLQQMAFEQNVPLEKSLICLSDPPIRLAHNAELAHLERNYHVYPTKDYLGTTSNLVLFSATNRYSELEETAREILRLCRVQGWRYRDIAVVVRNLPQYAPLLDVVFSQYGIPCFIDQKTAIDNHPLIRLVLAVLDIFIESWSYEAVFRYLKTGLTGIEREQIDILENYVLACGIRGNRWIDEQDWTMRPGLIPDERSREALDESLQQINLIRYTVTQPLMAFRTRTKGGKPAIELCSALFDLLCVLDIPATMEKYVAHFRQSGELNLASEYSQVWNILMQVLDQVVEVLGDQNLGVEHFARILRAGLVEYKIGLVPPALDQVLVGSVDRSKSHEVKALFILGVNDGIFPASAAPEGILSDRDRGFLRTVGLELAGDTLTKSFEEQYLVYRALSTASHHLRLSWTIADPEGKTMRPSMIIARLHQIFPGILEQSDITLTASSGNDIEHVEGRRPTFNHMVAVLREHADGMPIPRFWPEVYRWYLGQSEWQGSCTLIRSAFGYNNQAEPVSRDKISSLYGNPVYSSVSRLEKYTTCPFAYYVEYGLGAKERKVFQLTPPDIGTFMHTVIERFSRLAADQVLSWHTVDYERCTQVVSNIVDDILNNMRGNGLSSSNRYTAQIVRLKRVLVRGIWMIAEQIRRSRFTPVGYELDFGDNGLLPPISLSLECGEELRLTGRIDRVDALTTENGTYLRIVDYKSGHKAFRLSDVFHGLQLQLVTYLDAVGANRHLKVTPPVLPGGVLYFHIDDPLVRGTGRETPEELDTAVMKQLRMKGLLLADVPMIQGMDQTIDGDSLIIPASIKKDGTLGRSSAASVTQFGVLREYVRTLLRNIAEDMLTGQVPIRPYMKKETTSCQYCNYHAICQFDPSQPGNSYQLLHDKADAEVWDLMQQQTDCKGGRQ